MAESEYMTVAEATAYLRVGSRKMADLLKNGTLHWEADPLDKRSKLIPRAEVEALRARSAKGRNADDDGQR